MAGNMQESLSVRHMRAEIRAIEAQEDLDRLRRDYLKEKKRMMNSKKAQANDVEHLTEGVPNAYTIAVEAWKDDVSANRADLTQNQKRLMAIEAMIAKCEATIRRANVLRRQHELLTTYVDGTQNEEMLKNVSFWQNIINYLLYAVFTCNAFITGLGVSDGVKGSTGGSWYVYFSIL